MLDELIDIFFIEALFFSPALKWVVAVSCSLAGVALGTLVIYNGNLVFGIVIYAISFGLVWIVMHLNRKDLKS